MYKWVLYHLVFATFGGARLSIPVEDWANYLKEVFVLSDPSGSLSAFVHSYHEIDSLLDTLESSYGAGMVDCILIDSYILESVKREHPNLKLVGQKDLSALKNAEIIPCKFKLANSKGDLDKFEAICFQLADKVNATLERNGTPEKSLRLFASEMEAFVLS